MAPPPSASPAAGTVHDPSSQAQATSAVEQAVSQQSDNVAHALAGAGGGLFSMALTYPLITLSTRAQVESRSASEKNEKRPGTIEAARRIIEREGLSGLYAGLESALFGISVTNFVYYYWYEWSRSGLRSAAKSRRGSSELSTLDSILAGALAGCATVFITNPIWVVNTRMTTNRAAAKSMSTISTFLHIIRTEGVSRLFAGVIPALVLVSNPILQYTFFEQMKIVLLRRRAAAGAVRPAVTPVDAFLLGAIGKLLATTVTYPYITLKSRMHVAQSAAKSSTGPTVEPSPPPGVIASLIHLVRTDGWAGLYAGIGPKLTQSVLTAALLFAFKDVLYSAASQALITRRSKTSSGR